jgi:hypothetical protein
MSVKTECQTSVVMSPTSLVALVTKGPTGLPSLSVTMPIQVALPARAKYLGPACRFGNSMFTSLAPAR